MIFLLYILPAVFISLILVQLVKNIATHYRIGSLPSPRKIHSKFVPLLGGLGFPFAVVLTILLAQLLGHLKWDIWSQYSYFWIGYLVILLTGIIDDLKGLNSLLKFLGESAAAILLIMGGTKILSLSGPIGEPFSLGYFALPFTFLWILLIINAINLLDGLDGLAGGVGLIISIGLIFIIFRNEDNFLLLLTVGLAGGLIGFLRYNYHPAKIFMGDTGSLQLGYLISFLSLGSLKIAGSHQVYFGTALVLLGVPLTDTFLAFLRRLGEGKNPFAADKEHIHHRLLHLGLNHRDTVWMLYIFTSFYVLSGVLMVYYRGIVAFLLFIAAVLFSFFWVWRLGYIETRFSLQNIINQFNKAIPAPNRAPLHLNRIWHKLLLIISDLFMLNFALYLTYWLKFHSGILSVPVHRPSSDYFSTPVFILFSLGWILLFAFNNLYSMDWDISRFDKTMRVTKVVTFGIVVLGIITSDKEHIVSGAQIASLLFYWASIVILVNSSRLILIFIEKKFALFNYSPKNTLIIGSDDLSRRILKDIQFNPHLIFNVVGVVSQNAPPAKDREVPFLGNYKKLPKIIHQYKVEEVIIALTNGASDEFIEILSLCEPQEVKIKVPPGAHDIYSGQNESFLSHAYLQIFPEKMVLWQWVLKRAFDIFFSGIGIILLLPFFLLSAISLRLKYRKSVLVKIPILGKHGIPFKMYAFRLSRTDYDFENNPVYLGRRTKGGDLGKFSTFLLKFRFYKLPQLLNVFLGDMSLTGPRPEPYEWYLKYQSSLPFLYRRVYVRPGLTGLAQIKYHYELTQKILQEMLNYDIFYVENMSLHLDFRILLRTFLIFFRKSNNSAS